MPAKVRQPQFAPPLGRVTARRQLTSLVSLPSGCRNFVFEMFQQQPATESYDGGRCATVRSRRMTTIRDGNWARSPSLTVLSLVAMASLWSACGSNTSDKGDSNAGAGQGGSSAGNGGVSGSGRGGAGGGSSGAADRAGAAGAANGGGAMAGDSNGGVSGGSSAGADAGGSGARQCGKVDCGADQLCLVPCCSPAVAPCTPASSGSCPMGLSPVPFCPGSQGPGCQAPACVPAAPKCIDIEPSCADDLSCGCLDSPCETGSCAQVLGGTVRCACE